MRAFSAETVQLETCRMEGNIGGGIYALANSTILVDCTIVDNTKAWNGGGVYCFGDYARLVRCVLKNNQMGASGSGGGVYARTSTTEIESCVIDGNQAGTRGGGIFISSDIVAIRLCNISGNSADGDEGGGVVCLAREQAVIEGCLITGNSSVTYGGGISVSGNWDIVNCHIADNVAGDNGGGLRARIGETGIVNGCVIARNSAGADGGGVYVYATWGDDLDIVNCAIVDNAAGGLGGGLYVRSTTASVANTVLWNDRSGAEGPEIALVSNTTLTVSHGDVEGAWALVYIDGTLELICADGNIVTDPLFVDAENGDYHLSAESPCIDAGDPAFVPDGGARDMDDEKRVWNERIDMGADEFGSFVFADLNCDGSIDLSDVGPFIQALIDPDGYEGAYPECDLNLGDVSGDGSVDLSDVEAFIELLLG